jgi:hypothetical protein
MLVTIYFASKASRSSKESLKHSEIANNHAQIANNHAERANDISIGQTETALREQIAIARQRMEDVGFKLQEVLSGRSRKELTPEETKHLEFVEKSWNSAVEGYLNAYEDACGKFLDKKIDPVRFKRIYIEEVRNICNPKRESYARHMHPDATSKFEAIWKVHKEWLRYEK